MKKVLIISTVEIGYNGIINIILSLLKEMDKKELQLYMVGSKKSDLVLKKRFENLGIQVVELPSRKKETLKYLYELSRFIKENKINTIHAHGNSATLFIEMLAGILGGCPQRISHSHNTKCTQIKMDKILRPFFYSSYTDALACGELAGKWLYKNRPFKIIENGRDIDYYSFNSRDRVNSRRELNIQGEIVLGHVGEFNEQKNHQFIIKVFREILKMQPKVKLLLIGEGPLKDNLIQETKDISESIIFLGKTDKVSYYLNAMDGALFPSLYEGLPLVMVEWQINGLPILCSDKVTRKCAFNKNIAFLSLEENVHTWAQIILELIKNNDRKIESELGASNAKRNGFDIKKSAKELRKIYLK